jgi:hypothetical protein
MIAIVSFLAFMLVMTMVSRVVNKQYIPIIQTKVVRSGSLDLNSEGKGVLLYGILPELAYMDDFKEPFYYIRGSLPKKENSSNLTKGKDIMLIVNGAQEQGTVIAKIYNYQRVCDDILVRVSGNNYILGSEADFVLEKNRVKFECVIPREVLYEDVGGNYYIYLLEEKDGILGNYTVTAKTRVSVVAMTEIKAALKEIFETKYKIDCQRYTVG